MNKIFSCNMFPLEGYQAKRRYDSLPGDNSIRKLYTPIQPTVKESAYNVRYYEFLPDQKLQPFIYCYWQLKTTQTLKEQFNYKVVSDGCIDIIFELNHPEESHIMGFCKKYTEFPLDCSFNYVGVRFLPTMFPQLFKISAIELSNRFEDLDVVVPHLSLYIANNFNGRQNQEEIKTQLDSYFLDLIAKTTVNKDNRLYRALEIVFKNLGTVDIEKDLNTGISPRQLRRLSDFYIGDTVKTFSKVVRFQNILKANLFNPSLRQSQLFLDAGYYDQSHFIREFKNFYGATPSKVLEK